MVHEVEITVYFLIGLYTCSVAWLGDYKFVTNVYISFLCTNGSKILSKCLNGYLDSGLLFSFEYCFSTFCWMF